MVFKPILEDDEKRLTMQRRASGTKDVLAKAHDNTDVFQKLKKVTGILQQTGQKNRLC